MEKDEVKYDNIYQKLLVIQQTVHGLGKDKKAYGYSYVTGDKLLGEVKPLMNELGLLLKQEVLSIENVRHDYETKNGSKSEVGSKVMMRFTWVDSATGEKDENLFGANGQNDWDKGVGSALTYAERYFLMKFFHIATDEDDIDNPDRKTNEPVIEKVAPSRTRTEKVVVPQQAHESGKIEPNAQALPIMNEAQFKKAIQRINEGEVDLFPKLRSTMQIGVSYYNQLNEAHEFSLKIERKEVAQTPAPAPVEEATAEVIESAPRKTRTRKKDSDEK